MSDFYSVFWDYYVRDPFGVSVLGCAVLLWMQTSGPSRSRSPRRASRRRPATLGR